MSSDAPNAFTTWSENPCYLTGFAVFWKRYTMLMFLTASFAKWNNRIRECQRLKSFEHHTAITLRISGASQSFLQRLFAIGAKCMIRGSLMRTKVSGVSTGTTRDWHFAGNFYEIFQIPTHFSGLLDELKPRIGPKGVTYFRLDFEVIILFGLTEFKAQLAWKEKVSPRSVSSLRDWHSAFRASKSGEWQPKLVNTLKFTILISGAKQKSCLTPRLSIKLDILLPFLCSCTITLGNTFLVWFL